jgi:hypothetical protein
VLESSISEGLQASSQLARPKPSWQQIADLFVRDSQVPLHLRSMFTIPILFLSFALAVAIVALARERRLRQALQALLVRLLSRWRNHGEERNHFDRDSDNNPPNDRLSEP